ncbi:Inducible Bartonella autotransporter [Bartonella australis AUST/NH1]|uniref:Inducible Bartonella autotransporter n=1 Tax=Bartonella australis (strain Aust/NH1) TaxID=1094489 RepID=M1P4W9_BARAA|nr:autotransporter outer membrane beta-barrel domain-containing protein [Bartonella australis]AGF74900.1 Inducible Bartonella autotransporter [Bartonella australis AUST/NH1]
MCKRGVLLRTVAGFLFFSDCSVSYANGGQVVHPMFEVKNDTKIVRNFSIRDRNGGVYANGQNAVATIINGAITSEFFALNASNGGTIDAMAIDAKTTITGLQSAGGTINLEDSTVIVKGDHNARAIAFQTQSQPSPDGVVPKNTVILTNTKLLVEDGIGIIGSSANNIINLKNSAIHADVLLKHRKNAPGSNLTLTADRSFLEGRTRPASDSTIVFNLNNGSQWLLKISKNEPDNDKNPLNFALSSIKERAQSKVSVLNLDDSALIFEEPKEGYYQTLHIHPEDPGAATVYTATGNAEIYLNTEWRDATILADQKIDRLMINGNVSGSTTINVRAIKKREEIEKNGPVLGQQKIPFPRNAQGVSVVQVSGQADGNSFKLKHGYTTFDYLPYKYELNAYGPTSRHGAANAEEKGAEQTLSFPLNERDRPFWDFRLQNAYLDSDAKIKALVPQVANYLLMPNALFFAGFTDFSNQSAILANMQVAELEAKKDKRGRFFLSSYGSKATLSSDRIPSQYAYEADALYAAVQAGTVFSLLENQDITAQLGFVGTYGQLSFSPKNVGDSNKTTLNKWSSTVYSGVGHRSGLYMDALLSYDVVRGNISNALAGNTAKLDDGKMLRASTTIGQKLITDIGRLVFVPQAQLIYQRLMLKPISDADNFEVDMGDPQQWLVRVGGYVTKDFVPVGNGQILSFYSKLNFIKAFGDGGTMRIGDVFSFDSTGSSIEAGLGINAQLSQIALYGDFSYRRKIQKLGVSGAAISGGMRYRF